MGHVNAFINEVTPEISILFRNYMGGALYPAIAARALEPEKPFPRGYAPVRSLVNDFIIFPLVKPLTEEDVGWLFEHIVVEGPEGVPLRDADVTRETMVDYSFRRIAGPILSRRGASDRTRARAKEFRRGLELPAMGLRHYRNTVLELKNHTLDFISLENSGEFVVIEYNARRAQRPSKEA